MSVKASVIILDYHKSRRVVKNVESLMAQKVDFEFEVIIVDNSANPKNAKKLAPLSKYKNIKVFINEINIGYTQGNNRGGRRAKGEYLLIVNPDILWGDTHNFQKLIDKMDADPSIGVLGPQQINDSDDSVAMTVRAFPNLPLQVCRRTFLRKLPFIKHLVAKDECKHLDYSKTQPVDWLQSSFWVTRRNLWNKFGGLNRHYFIFMSDPDYCWKTWKAGFKVIYDPTVKVFADGIRASQGGLKDFFGKWILRQHVADSVKYTITHAFRKNPRTTGSGDL